MSRYRDHCQPRRWSRCRARRRWAQADGALRPPSTPSRACPHWRRRASAWSLSPRAPSTSPNQMADVVESDAAIAIAIMQAANNGNGPRGRTGGVPAGNRAHFRRPGWSPSPRGWRPTSCSAGRLGLGALRALPPSCRFGALRGGSHRRRCADHRSGRACRRRSRPRCRPPGLGRPLRRGVRNGPGAGGWARRAPSP